MYDEVAGKQEEQQDWCLDVSPIIIWDVFGSFYNNNNYYYNNNYNNKKSVSAQISASRSGQHYDSLPCWTDAEKFTSSTETLCGWDKTFPPVHRQHFPARPALHAPAAPEGKTESGLETHTLSLKH